MTTHTFIATSENIDSITPDQVARVYQGKRGCACGCRGLDTSDPQEIARILEIVKDDADTDIHGDMLLLRDDARQMDYAVFLHGHNHAPLEKPSGVHWDSPEALEQWENDFGEDYRRNNSRRFSWNF